jgi:AcrR family transcriptional regulator
MAPRTEEQFEVIREEKKKLIKSTALELFANVGYYPTSISQIAKNAGISKGLIYNYFESKEELIREIIFDGFDEFLKAFDPNKDGFLTKEEFIFFINETFRIVEQNINYWRLYFTIIFQPGVLKLVEHKFLEMLSSLMKVLHGFLQRSGSTNPEADARLFGALLDGVCLHYVLDPEHFPLEEVKHKIIELFIKD